MRADPNGGVVIEPGDLIQVSAGEAAVWTVEVADIGVVRVEGGYVVEVLEHEVPGYAGAWLTRLVPVPNGDYPAFLTTADEVFAPNAEPTSFIVLGSTGPASLNGAMALPPPVTPVDAPEKISTCTPADSTDILHVDRDEDDADPDAYVSYDDDDDDAEDKC